MKYRVDGIILDTDRALRTWEERTEWNGRNRISVNTGSQWEHERLYQSRKGRYYIEAWSNWQGSQPHASIVTAEEAAAWLLFNGHELPSSLQAYAERLVE